jgi:DNA-binding Xre family transcriptional regulator
MIVKNKVKSLIQKKWKTLIQISEATGLSFQQLSAIQNNKPTKISYETIAVLISYFKCSFNDLFEIHNG